MTTVIEKETISGRQGPLSTLSTLRRRRTGIAAALRRRCVMKPFESCHGSPFGADQDHAR